MKNFGLLAAAALAVSIPNSACGRSAAVPAEADTAKLVEARAIIAVVFPPAQRQQMTDKMLNDITAPMRANFPKAAMEDPGLHAIVDDFINQSLAAQRPLMARHFPALLEAMATAYTREFSLAELKDIHAFADTPSGRHYLSKSTAMIGDPAVMKVNAAIVADAQATGAPMLADFKAKLMAYLQSHPDVMAKIAAQGQGK